MLGNNSTFSTYENSTYGIRVRYPPDWRVQQSKSSDEPINVAGRALISEAEIVSENTFTII
jgi:hypothetical protein